MKLKSPSRKMLEKLLFEHAKTSDKFTKNYVYKQFLPYSKRFIVKWAEENLYGPPFISLIESIHSVELPIKFNKRYPEIQLDTWKILNDPAIRERIELELVFDYDVKEIHSRINHILKPHKISIRGINQFGYYFWNLKNKKGESRPSQLIKYLEYNKKISSIYHHIIKYYNDKNGHEKYQYHYSIGNSAKLDINNLNQAINLSIIGQKEAFEIDDIERVHVHSKILLNDSNSLKNIRSDEDTGIPDLSIRYKVEENNSGKDTK